MFPTNSTFVPVGAHPGAFGYKRKYNFHEGVDLYGKEGDVVYAINSGVVVANLKFTGEDVGSNWWLPTDAIIVKSNTEYFVYGELKSHLVVGDYVHNGQLVGRLLPVLPHFKIRVDIPNHSNVMLHLEKYNLSYDVSMGFSSWTSLQNRPVYLEDPTKDLIFQLNSGAN